MDFMKTIFAKAKADKKTVVLPESTDPRMLEAASRLLKEGIANIVLIGNKTEIEKAAPQWDITGAQIIDPLTSENFEDFVTTFYEMRKAKGVTPESARETMQDALYFSVMLVKKGLADGMVAGAVNSTANTLRPALQILKTAPGVKMVSSYFMMVVPECELGANGTFLFSDCALVENPSADQLSEIAVSSAASFEALTGEKANVAMLSYSTYGSAKSELTEKVIEATRLAKEKAPQINLDGELQLDAAVVPSVGKSKAAGSPVAGSANVLIFPDLNAGNIGYKLVQRLAGADAYGPITQGIAAPVNDLSRGCNADDIVGVVALTAVQAQAVKK